MSVPSSPPTPGFPLSWGVALAAASLLLIGGGAVIWSSRPDDNVIVPPIADPDQAKFVRTASRIPQPQDALATFNTHSGLHTVAYSVENGTRVVKIKVVESGDELVVDAATGRLLETRPSRPTAPPPMGKFAAPFDPMT
jgi:hypothetical protein